MESFDGRHGVTMCFPSNTPAGQAFIGGPAGFVRDKVFGRGTSQKLVDRLDKVHARTVGRIIPTESLGHLPGSLPSLNKSGTIDLAAEKDKRRRRISEVEKLSFLRENQNATILGE